MKFGDFIRKYWFLIVILIIGYLIWEETRETKPKSSPNSDQVRNMKGFDLFVWNNGDKTMYSLLPGTNRLKDSAEIYNATTAFDWNSTRSQVDNIAPGEYVLIKPLDVDSASVSEIRTYLEKRKLVVSVLP